MSKQRKNSPSASSSSCSVQSSSSSLSSSWKLFLWLCLFRIVNTFCVQSYFDPDEFWQTLEPAYCHVFAKVNATNNDSSSSSLWSCPGFTWEWKRRASTTDAGAFATTQNNLITASMLGPARTHLSILFVWIYYQALDKYVAPFWNHVTNNNNNMAMTWLVSRGPMILNAITVAAPTDWLIFYMGKTRRRLGQGQRKQHDDDATAAADCFGKEEWWCLLGSLVSWFGAFTMVRSFANAQETFLIAASMALVAPEFFATRQQRWFHLRSAMAFYLGGLAASIRFTALAAYVPMGLILANHANPQQQQQQRFLVWPWTFLVQICAVFGALGIFTAMLVDRFFFGFWTIPFVANFHFNVVLDFADSYGSHPWHWNFSTGLPVVTGLLLPLAVAGAGGILNERIFSKRQRWGQLPQNGSIRTQQDQKQQQAGGGGNKGNRNLWIVILSYLTIMSLNAHKEFRFLLPVLPMFCLLAGPCMAQFCTRKDGTAAAAAAAAGMRANRDNDNTNDNTKSWWSVGRQIRWFRLTWIVLPNLVALLYLGLFHQTGPISVNKWIVQDARQRWHSTEQQQYGNTLTHSRQERIWFRIYYWTGNCHSTPLHSHLHAPLLPPFETFALDCSPTCRADPLLECETDQFRRDPLTFVERHLWQQQLPAPLMTCATTKNDGDKDNKVCTAATLLDDDGPLAISYVVTRSLYMKALKPKLAELGIYEAARFPHNINGARFFGPASSLVLGGDDFASPHYRHFSVISPGLFEMSLDEMIVLRTR